MLSPIAAVSEHSTTPDTTMRSSLGKRSYSDFDDIPRTEAYDNDISMLDASPLPAPAPRFAETLSRSSPPPPPPPAERPGRIIAVAAYTVYTRTAGIIAGLWSWLTTPRATQPTHVYAIETTASGKKRRAIAADDLNTSEPNMHDLPGHFPEPSLVITPPDSRPASSDSKEQQDAPVQQQQQVQEEAPMASAPPATPEKKTVKLSDIFPELRKMTLEENMAHIQAQLAKDAAIIAADKAWAAEREARKALVKAHQARARERPLVKVTTPEEQKDARINGLIQRGNQAKGGKPYVTFKDIQERRRAHLAAEEEAKEEARLRAEAIVEAERALERKKEAARVKALKEEEEAKAVEEARIKAIEAEKAALIKPLNPEHLAKLNTMMEIRNDRHIVTVSPEGVDLTRRDFGTLLAKSTSGEASAWLNDEVVNAYFSTIVSRKLEQDNYVKGPKNVPAFVAYNTAWYTTYRTKGIDGIATWSRRKAIKGDKLFRAEKVFFPINTGIHWMLLVISPKTRTIEFLDSMHNFHPGDHKHWMGVGRKWLKMELGSLYNPDDWTESPAQSSLQTNGNDCGAFTCLNALASATGADYGEVTAGKMQEARRHIGAVLLNGRFAGIAEL